MKSNQQNTVKIYTVKVIHIIQPDIDINGIIVSIVDINGNYPFSKSRMMWAEYLSELNDQLKRYSVKKVKNDQWSEFESMHREIIKQLYNDVSAKYVVKMLQQVKKFINATLVQVKNEMTG